MKIIRSDRFIIQTDKQGKADLSATLSLYQSYVRGLMILLNARWSSLGQVKGNAIIKDTEALIHPTQQRPIVKHRYFHQCFYKFPSYLRRVAIMDAFGQVKSFHTRYDTWLDTGMKGRPPALTCSTNTFPSLYQGQCIKFNDSGSAAFIKVFSGGDWVWRCYRLSGQTRFLGKGKKLSSLLVINGKRWELSIPSKLEVSLKEKTQFSGKVLAVDVGINTAATCAVVDQHGTVLDRCFINRSDKDRERQLMQRIRTKARKQTRHGNKLPQGFCANDHRRLKQLATNQAHQISRQIVTLARDQYCDAIVLENLKGWKPKAGRKRSTMKAKFHRWFHRMLTDRIESKAIELGIRVLWVYARGTSSNAYDGSGKVRRDKDNYANARFSNGKRYNADLNAAYNIAARGAFKLYYPSLCEQQWSKGKPNACPTTGNPLVLSSLWLLSSRKAS